MNVTADLTRVCASRSIVLTVRGDDDMLNATPPLLKGGDQVWLEVEIRDNTLPLRPLTDPGTVTATLKAPDGTTPAVDLALTRASQGKYTLRYQTPALGPFGEWDVAITSTDGADVNKSLPRAAFNLVAPA